MKNIAIFGVVGLLLGGLGLYVSQVSRSNYESPDYVVVRSDGAFEIRDYPAITVVTSPMRVEGDQRNAAFMNLFSYISGENDAAQKISMTTPVITSQVDGKAAMSFVVPEAVASAGAPRANDQNVEVLQRESGRFAVYRYSGSWTKEKEAAAVAQLSAWIESEGLELQGGFEKANYDPPFMLPVLRRNEAMVRIKN